MANRFKQNGRRSGKKLIQSKKCEWNGILYDSVTERDFHQHLLAQPDVKYIFVQPEYQVLPPYQVECHKCRGNGKFVNPKTGRPNKCTLCGGSGKRKKNGAVYTPDFRVEYEDGYIEVIDVKGFANETYPLKRRMFEATTGIELVTVERGKYVDEWKRSTVKG